MNKALIELILVILSVSACNVETPKVIEYTSFAQYLTEENKIAESTNQLKIIFFKDMIMYVIPQVHEYEDGREINSFTFNVIRKNTDYGVSYKEGEQGIKKIKLDSILATTNLNSDNMNFFSYDFGKASSIDTIASKGIVIERFLSPIPSFAPDSVYRFYDLKLKNDLFSLSPSLEKTKQSKLIRVELVTSAKDRIYKGKVRKIPKLKYCYEWRENNTDNLKDVVKFFERFNEDVKKLNLK